MTCETSISKFKMESLVKPHKCNHNVEQLLIDKKTKQFIQSIPKLTELEAKEIEQKTTNQSNISEWFDFRKGRITASKFYAVHTKSQVLNKGGTDEKSINVDSVLSILMKYKSVSDEIQALKYGK